MSTLNEYYCPGEGKKFHFNDEGFFVDENNSAEKNKFRNSDVFSNWLHQYLQRIMEEKYGLDRVEYPKEGGSLIWMDKDFLTTDRDRLFIIQGSGRVRPGLFSIGVCAYHGLEKGSVFPFLEFARSNNISSCVLNPNCDKGLKLLNGQEVTADIFNKIKDKGGSVFIIAHSMGGIHTEPFLEDPSWFISKVKAVALTDALEPATRSLTKEQAEIVRTRVINWLCSEDPLDTPISNDSTCFQHRSAGTRDHPLSTGIALQSILEFFNSKL